MELLWGSVHTCVIVNVHVRVCTCTPSMSACLPACQSVYLPVCTVLWRPGRRIEDSGRGKKCCQSVLDEQGADGSRREDGWRAGAMHYSGVIQSERDHWGKTQHTYSRTWIPHTHTWPKSCVLQQKLPEASSANPNSILRTLSFPHTTA